MSRNLLVRSQVWCVYYTVITWLILQNRLLLPNPFIKSPQCVVVGAVSKGSPLWSNNPSSERLKKPSQKLFKRKPSPRLQSMVSGCSSRPICSGTISMVGRGVTKLGCCLIVVVPAQFSTETSSKGITCLGLKGTAPLLCKPRMGSPWKTLVTSTLKMSSCALEHTRRS